MGMEQDLVIQRSASCKPTSFWGLHDGSCDGQRVDAPSLPAVVKHVMSRVLTARTPSQQENDGFSFKQKATVTDVGLANHVNGLI